MSYKLTATTSNCAYGVSFSESPKYLTYDGTYVWAYGDPTDMRPYYGDNDLIDRWRFLLDGSYDSYSEDAALADNNNPPSPAPVGTYMYKGTLSDGRHVFYGWATGPKCYVVTSVDRTSSDRVQYGESSGEIYISISQDRDYLLEWHRSTGNYYIYNNSFTEVASGTVSTCFSTHTTNGQDSNYVPKTGGWSAAIGTLESVDNGTSFRFWTNHGRAFTTDNWWYVWDLNDSGDAPLLAQTGRIATACDGYNSAEGIVYNGQYLYFGRDDNRKFSLTGVTGNDTDLALEADSGSLQVSTMPLGTLFWT